MKRLSVHSQTKSLNAIKGTSVYRELSANQFVYDTERKDARQNKVVLNKAFIQRGIVSKSIYD